MSPYSLLDKSINTRTVSDMVLTLTMIRVVTYASEPRSALEMLCCTRPSVR